MSTMGVVMAEASRVPVVQEEVEETYCGDQEENVPTSTSDASKITTKQNHATSSSLTSAALASIEPSGNNQTSTIISLGNSNDTNLKHLVRYFRSSCSSAGASVSAEETSVSTPTTTSTTLATSRRHVRRIPVRISFVPLDPDLPLEEQHGGVFDCILHKLTEDLLSCSLEDDNKEASLKRVQTISSYRSANPICSLVDDPMRVQTLMSRSDIARVLESCLQGVTSASGIPVKAPKVIVVRDEDSATWMTRLRAKNLTAPFIVKPLVAAGTKQSHFLTILLQDSAVARVPPRSIIQQYVNHNSILYKVYVLGDNVFVYKRPSLPNLPPAPLDTNLELVEFDSQRPYPRLKDFGIEGPDSLPGGSTGSRSVPAPAVTRDEVRPVVETLKRAFGLELFGFDLLLGENKDEWLVVDVNYFPSYKEVPNFPSLLAHYLCQKVLEERRKDR